MSQRFPVRNAKEAVKVLRRHGFVLVAQSGSHQKWRHENGRQVIVAMHGSKPFPSARSKASLKAPAWAWKIFDKFRRPAAKTQPVWETVFGATPETATGTVTLPSKVPAMRPKAVWVGRTAFEHLIGRGDRNLTQSRKDAKARGMVAVCQDLCVFAPWR